MAVRNNKLSLEEVGGFLVDIKRPSDVVTGDVVVRGGTLVLNDQIKTYGTEGVTFTLPGMSGANYYKVLVYIDTSSGDILSTNAYGTFPTAQDAIGDKTFSIEPNQIPLAFVIVQNSGTPGDTFQTISTDQIVDLRSTVNVTRNIEQIYTTEVSPENLVIVANADGSLTATNSLQDLISVESSQIDIVGTGNADVVTPASPPSDSSASLTTTGGAAIDLDLHVGGDSRFEGDAHVAGTSTDDPTDFSALAAASLRSGGDAIIEGNLKTNKALLEENAITIGNGITNFGLFNATPQGTEPNRNSVIDTALLAALALALDLKSDDIDAYPKIHIKYGNYVLSSTTTINISIPLLVEGEGYGTFILVDGSLNLNEDFVTLSNLRLLGSSGASLGGTGSGCVVSNVFFAGVGDIDSSLALDNVFTGCVSTATTTNLP